MTTKDDGGPAFPAKHTVLSTPEQRALGVDGFVEELPGLTKREYAAIHLRVPDSGSQWLDEMIEKARRTEFAGRALAGLLSNSAAAVPAEWTCDIACQHAAIMLDK